MRSTPANTASPHARNVTRPNDTTRLVASATVPIAEGAMSPEVYVMVATAGDGLARIRSAAPRRREGERYDHRDPEAHQAETGHRDRRIRRHHHEQSAERGADPADPHGAHRAEPVHDPVAA